jgi:hypothetical protein
MSTATSAEVARHALTGDIEPTVEALVMISALSVLHPGSLYFVIQIANETVASF